jgi:hypothetical protein
VRQAFLVIVLVGASFLGGAFICGPGFHLAKTRILRSLGLNDQGGEIASFSFKAASLGNVVPDGSRTDPTQTGEILGQVASVIPTPGGDPTANYSASDQLSLSHPASNSNEGTAQTVRSLASSLRPPMPITSAPTGIMSFPRAFAPSDMLVQPARRISPSTYTSPVPSSPPVVDSLAALVQAVSPACNSSSRNAPQGLSVSKPVPDTSDEWALLEQTMHRLGVSHFTIDAELGHRAVVVCLIPLAGHRAVSQRFEAEGDDMVQAARAALRRIGIWRASRAPAR